VKLVRERILTPPRRGEGAVAIAQCISACSRE
jgi:hypothetical protein